MSLPHSFPFGDVLGPRGGRKQISGLEQGLRTRHGQDMDLHGLEIGVCESGGP